MDSFLDKYRSDLDAESASALVEAFKEIVVSHQKFHEFTAGSMLSDDTKKLRKTLVNTSLAALIMTIGGVFPTKISWLGIELTNANKISIYIGLWSVLVFQFRSFWWRADLEFSNSQIRRQSASTLQKLETLSIIAKTRKVNEDLSEALAQEFSFMIGDDTKDPYRASIMGVNFKSRFFELRLPHLIFIVASFSCFYSVYLSVSA